MTGKKDKKADKPKQRVIEDIAVDDLIPYAANARTHSEEQVVKLAGSIMEFGFNNPVLIDDKRGIIAGHGRVAAARKLGLKSVPCLVLPHLTEAQRRAYVLADNRMALDADWDMDMLMAEMKRLSEEDYDLRLTGFDQKEIDKMFPEDYSEGGPGPEIPTASFGLFIECKTEQQQQDLYDEFQRREIPCKLMN